MLRVGELVQTRKGWIVTPPTHCPNGHDLGPRRVSVVHLPCGGAHSGGHTLWRCNECGEAISHPAAGSACRILHGPAGIRNV